MLSYLLSRLLQAVVLLFLVSVVTFGLIHSAPGGPIILAQADVSPRDIEALKRTLQLTDPLPIRYLKWVGRVLRGDFGRSFTQGVPVTSLMLERLPNTLLLSGVSLLLAVAVAVPLGVLSAARRYTIIDHLATLFAFLGMSIPGFWLGIVLIIVFAVQLRWLPSGGMYTLGAPFSIADRLRYIILPSLVLAAFVVGQLLRYTRSGMISALGEDYVRTARAKGLPERAVLFGHALRNTLIPVVTVLGLQIPRLVGGAAVTESVFAWPGMGRLAVDAAFQRDYPLIMGVTMLVSAVVIVSNLVVDLLYTYLDPRVRLR
jgi:peptide/nickel transport system permease protein